MRAARVQVLLSAVCFGTTGTAQALGPAGIPPAVVGAARIAVGGALLVLLALGLGRPRAGRRRLPRVAVAVAALGVAAYQLAFFAAVADTGVAIGTVVALGSAPAITGALEWLIERRRPDARWLPATALACAGVALLVLAGAGTAGVSASGVGLALLAGAAYATYTLAAKRMLERGHAPEPVMAAAFGTGALLLAPVLALGDTAGLWTPGGIVLAAFLGVVPTALAYILFARGLRHLSAADTSTLTLAEPLTAAVLGVVVLAERPGPGALAGGGLVLAGLALLALTAPRSAPRPAAGVAAELP
ncbi:MAG: drug/metabolite transporter, family [Solirubrobacteraceae bacterium]|jgi:DME family drug/metabolite transporter|nr:drug/metabolite transporter, family [Solirubrobacteraceae bacterium]